MTRIGSSDDPCLFETCSMNPHRIVTCWLTRDGIRGTDHHECLSIAPKADQRGAIWPRFVGTYLTSVRPPSDSGACLFYVDHGDPDANQIIFDNGGQRP